MHKLTERERGLVKIAYKLGEDAAMSTFDSMPDDELFIRAEGQYAGLTEIEINADVEARHNTESLE